MHITWGSPVEVKERAEQVVHFRGINAHGIISGSLTASARQVVASCARIPIKNFNIAKLLKKCKRTDTCRRLIQVTYTGGVLRMQPQKPVGGSQHWLWGLDEEPRTPQSLKAHPDDGRTQSAAEVGGAPQKGLDGNPGENSYIIHPSLIPFLQNARVDSLWRCDVHTPLFVDFAVPSTCLQLYKWQIPASWAEWPPAPDDFHNA